MISLDFNKLWNYGTCTAIGLILAATAGCAAQTGAKPASAATPSGLSDLIHTDINAGQKTLEARGYQIVYLSLLAKEQYWWNAGSQICVSLKVKDQEIDALTSINNVECTKRVASVGKVWNGDSDAPASFQSPSMDRERE